MGRGFGWVTTVLLLRLLGGGEEGRREEAEEATDPWRGMGIFVYSPPTKRRVRYGESGLYTVHCTLYTAHCTVHLYTAEQNRTRVRQSTTSTSTSTSTAPHCKNIALQSTVNPNIEKKNPALTSPSHHHHPSLGPDPSHQPRHPSPIPPLAPPTTVRLLQPLVRARGEAITPRSYSKCCIFREREGERR